MDVLSNRFDLFLEMTGCFLFYFSRAQWWLQVFVPLLACEMHARMVALDPSSDFFFTAQPALTSCPFPPSFAVPD